MSVFNEFLKKSVDNTKIIENEIQQYGNTNRIADSGFVSGQQIFAIGDSHCLLFEKSMKIKIHWLYGMPISIYSLCNEGLDIYNIGNNLERNQGHFGRGHSSYNIKNGDFVILYFGSNDMQRNIHLHAENRWREEIQDLINKYINFVIKMKNDYKIIPIISSIYPNPRIGAEGQNPLGTYEQRSQYILFANTILKEVCTTNNIPFLGIYDIITDNDGFIKESFTKDKIHLTSNNQFIYDYLHDKIFEICNNNINI